MTRLLAIAELRLREGLSARLAWLVLVAFVVGIGAAHWARGADEAARAAQADRVALWTAWGLAFVVAAVVPALGLPSDVRTGAAQTLLSSPASRFEVVAGGVLGYGALSTLLLLAMSGASVLGMQTVGVGAAQRDPVRPVGAAEIAAPNSGDAFVVQADAPTAAFRFRVPQGLAPGEALRVRLAPRAYRVETGMDRATVAVLSLHRPGEGETDPRQVRFKAGTAITAHLDLGGLRPGDEAELTFRRASGRWKLRFEAGAVEIGGARRLFAWSLLTASVCAAPLLLLLAAVGSLGAARFAAPTAVILAASLFLVVVGRDLVVDGARFIVESAGAGPSHAGHSHGPPEFSATQVALAKGAIAALSVVPRMDAFDLTDELVERRAPTAEDVGRAAAQGLPAAALLTAAAWILLRRREIAPG
jgi:hypothetical protein